MLLHNLISRVAGQSGELSGEKIALILRGVILIVLFTIIFVVAYRRYFWHSKESRNLFYWSTGLLFLVVVSKYAIFHFFKGYIPDHLFFYALPSPKVKSFGWFILPCIIFIIFLKYRQKILNLPTKKFLLALWATFVSFAVSVATTREGIYSIYERFSRVYWEYTGNLPLVKTIGSFLHDYTMLNSQLIGHTTTHPPGYTIILYSLQQLFQVKFLGLAILVVMLGGLAIIPVYYFLKQWASEEEARKSLQFFIFLPSFVLLGATSMDVTLVLSAWLALATLFIGWKKSAWLALVGGVCAGFALFSNFLFLLFAPVLLYFAYQARRQVNETQGALVRIFVSLVGFIGFFIFLYLTTGYSIIENFYVAQIANHYAVASNFVSVRMYMVYLLASLTDFIIYSGIPVWLIIIKNGWSNNHTIVKVGFATVVLFLLVGVFQGETGRLWLFLLPLFVLFNSRKNDSGETGQEINLLSLLFFNTIILQTLFYTYW